MVASPQEIDEFAAFAKQKLCREQSDLSLDQLFTEWRNGHELEQHSRELESNHSRIEAILKDLDGDAGSGDSCEMFVKNVRDELMRIPR